MTTTPPSGGNPAVKFVVALAAVLTPVLGGLFIVKSQVKKAPASSQAVRKDALPDIELQLHGGGKRKLSEVAGKVTLINFWATWCSACVIEMPSILALRSAYKSKGFEVVAINLDEKPEAVLPKFLKKLGIDFPVYVDPDGAVGDLLDVSAIPLTVIVDKERRVLFTHNGELDWNSAEIRARLEGWLAR
jgi:thiol-disulfide isomerase/thioredoxin